jgi:response regulator RpfG family c-di-GMP phosphodiesterase
VSDYDTRRATRYLPQVVVATTAVAVMPVAAVWWLHANGAIASPWAGLTLAIALSLGASLVGSAYWKRRRGPRDLLFGELLVWGWLRRLRVERQLAKSMELLSDDERLRGDAPSAKRKFHVLGRLAGALDAQDAYTDGHSRRVAAHSVMVARRMGLSSEEVERVRAAAAVHDIGKLRVPADVLSKPGRLTSAEFELVKSHADAGAEIVACLGDPELSAIVRHHHERFDGAGYPSGLAGEQIPLGARIIAVADTFDALTSVRPYRPAEPHKRALEALVKASGTQLDPVAVRAFLRCYSGNRAIVFWTLLTVSPQRAVAWLGDKHTALGNVSFGSMATTIGAVTAIGVTAISAPIGPGPGRYELRQVHGEAPREIAAAPISSKLSAAPRSSHRMRHSPSTMPVPRRRHAAPASARVSAASLIAARHASRGSGSDRSHPLASGSGVTSSGGSRGEPGDGSGAGSGGGSSGRHAGGSGGGSSGGHAGGSGGGSSGGHAGGSGGGSSGGHAGGSGGASGAGSAGGLGGRSGGGSAGGAGGGSGTGSGAGSAGGSGGAASGGSPRGSSGGSGSGAGGGSGATATGMPVTKDQCKHGGYVRYGFVNQGHCVASVEHQRR